MPELPEVEVVKRSLESKILNSIIKKVQINDHNLSKSWGIHSEKIFSEDGNYLINHSSSIILLEDGKYLDRINHHATYKDMFKSIKKYLR